jgi:hypothetical protein
VDANGVLQASSSTDSVHRRHVVFSGTKVSVRLLRYASGTACCSGSSVSPLGAVSYSSASQ